MILSVARRFAARFQGADRVEVLAVLAQFPLFAVTIAVALLGPSVASWALLVFAAQAVIVLIGVAILEVRRFRRRGLEPAASGPDSRPTRVVGATPATEPWAVLAESPGDRRTLIERAAASLPLRHLTLFGLQNDSPLVYDVLAHLASGGRFDADGLAALGRDLETPAGARVAVAAGVADLDALVALARVMREHRHPGFPGVLSAAMSALRRVRPETLQMLAELLISVDRRDDAATVLQRVVEPSWARDRLLSDLLNPFTAPDGASEEAWLASVNEMYLAAGLEPIELDADTAAAPFDRMRVSAPSGSLTDGPLVSVIMSTYRPGRETLAAVRSILDQTWGRLELLVMDDASGPEYDDVLDAVAALDDRVKVVRAAGNAGTYVRRNDALLIARGDFVTIQDSDDWSHPRRLETQVRHLEAHPEMPANLLSTVRVSSELRFTQPRGTALRLAEPSLMFRRELVLDRVGFFDTVRRSADSEFRTRLERGFDLSVTRLELEAPLMLQRFDLVSLSGGDFGSGWTHPARFAYRSASLAWQRAESRAGRVPRMEFPAAGPRPFPAPARISGADAVPSDARIVVAGDGRATPGGEAERLEAVLRAAAGGRDRVAFLQLASLRAAQAHILEPRLQLLINAGGVGEVTLLDDLSVDLLVIAHADAVVGLPRTPGGIRAARVVVLADPELELAADGVGYALPHVRRLCLEHFGVLPEIRPISRRDPIDLDSL